MLYPGSLITLHRNHGAGHDQRLAGESPAVLSLRDLDQR
jgi:hypothetical protein